MVRRPGSAEFEHASNSRPAQEMTFTKVHNELNMNLMALVSCSRCGGLAASQKFMDGSLTRQAVWQILVPPASGRANQ